MILASLIVYSKDAEADALLRDNSAQSVAQAMAG